MCYTDITNMLQLLKTPLLLEQHREKKVIVLRVFHFNYDYTYKKLIVNYCATTKNT